MLQKELKDIERDKESGVRVELIGNSIRHLTGYVNGKYVTAVLQVHSCLAFYVLH